MLQTLVLLLIRLPLAGCQSLRMTGGRDRVVPVGRGGWIKGRAPAMIGAPRGDARFVLALP